MGAVTVSLGCGELSLEYKVRGRVETEDSVDNLPCSLDMYLDGRAERLTHFPIATGGDFGVALRLPLFAPGDDWHAIVRCGGYADALTRSFRLGAGWNEPAPVMLGVIKVTKSASP